jgi:hypothetical protein
MLDVEALSEMMAGIIAEEVDKAVAPLKQTIAALQAREPLQGPPGEKGDKGDKGDAGERGTDGADGQNGNDGRGVKSLLIDRNGELVATMDDGEVKSLGPIIGKDGEPGKDGRDGFGFDELDACVLDDDRTIELSFKRGEEEKAFTFKWPTVIYRSVFKEGEQYEAGDMVTWGGSLWHCDKATTAKPGTDDWTLACKKGRDGKDARIG